MKNKILTLFSILLLSLLMLLVYLHSPIIMTSFFCRVLDGQNPLMPWLIHRRAGAGALLASTVFILVLSFVLGRLRGNGRKRMVRAKRAGMVETGRIYIAEADDRPGARRRHIPTMGQICGILLLLLLGAGTFFSFKADNCPGAARRISGLRREIRSAGAIAHAGGIAVDAAGETYDLTNSMEALRRTINEGQQIIELDIRFSLDEDLICLHNWRKIFWSDTGSYKKRVPTADFLAGKVYNRFTTMTLDEVARIMRENPSLIIITDFKNKFTQIVQKVARDYPDLKNRFIIQIYHLTQYDKAWDAGFHNIIYTFYKAEDDELGERLLRDFAASRALVGFTIEKELFTENEKLRQTLQLTGVPIYVHTIDDPAEKEDLLTNQGVNAVYTDSLF